MEIRKFKCGTTSGWKHIELLKKKKINMLQRWKGIMMLHHYNVSIYSALTI